MPPSDQSTYIRPLGLFSGATARSICADGRAAWLAGGPLAFTHGEVITRRAAGEAARAVCAVPELGDRVARLSARREPFAGFAVSGAAARPLVMGVVNVTPDSFYDGGRYADPAAAVARGRALRAAGADLIDVGGESTRPGAEPLPVAQELERVMPVVAALAGEGVPVSIDTRRAAVMREAIAAGARVVNDVSALQHDPEALGVVASGNAGVVLMHMQGTPATMQRAPHYGDVVLDVYDALAERVAACEAAGIARARICVDPGIGFGKTPAHNLALISALGTLHGLGCALAIGVSRKSFIDAIAGPAPPDQRLPGSLAAMLVALGQGAHLVRVHDVAETVQAAAMWRQAAAAG